MKPAAPSTRRLLLGGALAALAAPALAQGTGGASGSGWAGGTTATLNALTARANAGTVGVISGGVDGTYVRIAADLAAVLDSEELRIVPVIGKGSIQNIRDIMLLRGIDIGIVQSDALAFARRNRLLPGLDHLIQYVTKLYDEEIHVLARADIASMEALSGQVVNVDGTGSGTAMTASLVFEAMGIRPRIAHDTQDVALTKLRAGEIAAMMFVAGSPARIFAGLPPDSGLRFLPIPATPTLMETYLPSALTHAAYPTLVAEGAEVETIAVGAVMAVYAWTPGTERHRKVARFVEALQARFEEFLRPPRHPKWREVNLAAEVPGWTRFDARATPRTARN